MAEVTGRDTIIYLMPGLTAAQRGAALRRLRHEARTGRGARLPGARVAAALAADRLRAVLRNVRGE